LPRSLAKDLALFQLRRLLGQRQRIGTKDRYRQHREIE
jgi:hypothetical protein